ncbi:alkaline phosphatase PhoX [Pelobacter seleniigenes]|uniref:alkaline phosphatase PhoX n=1 Tax=Pelobacter seleniigenes TaxID=407188 RepID=UPI00146FC666|nr:alkaline phosphatase PhoX [Pelobacter seleniigenes]
METQRLHRRIRMSFFLAPLLAALLLSGCSDNDNNSQEPPADMAFSQISVPLSDTQKRSVLATDSVKIDGTSYAIGYNTLLRSGQVIGTETFGLIRDYQGAPVIQEDNSEFISNSADFTSLLHLGDKLYSVTHFESQPGGMYLTELNQASDGTLTAVSTRSIDFSQWGGLWTPCAGSVTPWNTHLGSEEYEPDARAYEAATSKDDIGSYFGSMSNYFAVPFYAPTTTVADIKEVVNPYAYGYPTEVIVQENGSYSVLKHYAMGRMAVELPYVMPDRKTVYISDDGTNVGLFMFIADSAGDLSAGTLYAAQLEQLAATDGGSFNLSWIDLGHATFAQIKTAIDNHVVFSDIFDSVEPTTDGTCASGYTSINTTWGHECLAVKTGMETVASRLESRRYAAMLGATTELRKEEGISFDPDGMTLFVAMSEVAKGMEDGSSNDNGGPNQVRLAKNACGTVYQLAVGTDPLIGSDYVAKDMAGLISGIPTTYPDGSDYAGNTCNVNGIANPDNITFIPGKDTLIIGEDTGSGHQNDAIWAYDLSKDQLTRIQTTPYGSETTSPYIYPSLNGHGYLISVIQHPYGESDQDKLTDPADAAAYVGYIGPFPALGAEGPNLVDNTRGRQGMTSLNFLDVPAPTLDSEKRKIWGTPSASVNGTGHAIGFNTILRSGDSLGSATFGLLLDQHGTPLTAADNSQTVSNSNDFASLLDLGSSLYSVSHFESRPGAMYLTRLEQGTDGSLTPLSTQNIDFSAWGGLWVPCAGSVTPWNSHLGSEEYEPDARSFENATSIQEIKDNGSFDQMAKYFDVDPDAAATTATDLKAVLNPYKYGFPTEVSVAADGSYTIAKHYAMGRMAVELSYVMPDEKTVYISDDGTNVGFFMFVADTAGDLSNGTLYAAQLNQTDAADGGAFDINWIDLGHATFAELNTAINAGTSFSDIFDAVEPATNGSCASGYTSINTSWGHECLAVKTGMETLASRLESRRYAAMLGATTELRKEEGITFDPDGMTLYVAMSEVAKGMEDGSSNDNGGPNQVRLPKNACGTVYQLAVGTDSSIGSNYVAMTMVGLVNGTPVSYDPASVYAGNTCDINGIANPDNLTFIPGYHTLIIGEDTGSGHQNDVIWAYHLDTEELTRIQTTPYGSETTSPYFYPNIGGNAYLMSVVQHPYGESDQDQLEDSADAAAYTGFVGPFPAMDSAD